MNIDQKKLDETIVYFQTNPKVELDERFYPVYTYEMSQAFVFLKLDVDYLSNYEKITAKGIRIEEMNIGQLSAMFTFIQRGERFCDGHMATYIEDGTVLRLLLRLKELSKSLQNDL